MVDVLDQVFEEKPDPAPAWKLILGGAPDFVTAALCWLAWQNPLALGAEWVKKMAVVFLMEFFVIHSGGFMATFGNMPLTRLGRIGAQSGFVAFYFLFIWAFAMSLHASWLYFAFGWLFFSKILVSWSATRGAKLAIREQLIDWPFAVAAYLLSMGTGFTTFEATPGGVTEQVFLDSGLKDAGLFEDHPWVALAGGSIYFTAMGLWRLRVWRWFARPAAVG